MLIKAGVNDKAGYRDWRKEKKNEAAMARLFAYRKTDKKMPSVTALVSVFFHPTEPFVGLNYTPVAHNTLHGFPEGWTPVLRLCRGIIFDREGNLVAKPFNKFFNYGEMPETKNLPDEPYDATLKHDGHLGIIFKYKNRFFITTRGSFASRTSVVAAEMLADCADKNNWEARFPSKLTVLAEIIHPITKVHLNYGKKEKFVLIGAYSIATLEDMDHASLSVLGKMLGLEVTERWSGESLEDLKKLMNDLSVMDKEGYVVRFQSGLRVKFKFAAYINRMVEDKLSYNYIMKRMISGNLDRMIKNLPEEIYAKAQEMMKALRRVQSRPFAKFSEKEKRQYLYDLVPKEKSTSYYRGICREFLKHVEKQPG